MSHEAVIIAVVRQITYTNRLAMAMAGMTRPVRGTNTLGAQLGGTKG